MGLKGHNTSGGTDTLLAVYGGDIVNVVTGAGYGQSITSSNKAEFEVFLDRAWFVNGANANRYFDGSSWTTTGNEVRFPLARYIKRFKDRLYVAYVTILSNDYSSRVWYSDLPENDASGFNLTWGYETQTNLQQSVDNNKVISLGAQFKTYNIKVGDPFIITTGPNAGAYNVAGVQSETEITLTENLAVSDPADTYWVGGNWFDVSTDDNDVITGFGENSDRLLIFKRDSVHRYDGNSLKQIKGVPGTTSGRSVVNIRDFTFYFHRTGIYRLQDAVTATLLSRQIQAYIDGIDSAFFDDVVAWKVGEDRYRCFVGNITNTDEDISLTNAYLEYDLATQTWAVGTYPVSITVATEFIESQAKNIYFGTTTDEVFQDNTGNADGTTDIEWQAETAWHFPFETTTENLFTRIRLFTRNGRGINVKYKLYGVGTSTKGSQTISKDWLPLGDIEDYITEFDISPNQENKGKGIKFLMSEISSNAPLVVERINVYGKPISGRLKE